MKSLAIVLVIALIFTVSAYGDDKTDKLNQESSYTFSPGYVNAAKYQAESLLKAKMSDYKEKGFFERAVEYVKERVGYNAKRQQAQNQIIAPELQMKTSGTNDATQGGEYSGQAGVMESANYNVDIGTGTNQERDSSGRLIAEVINGTRHVYAGYSDVGMANIAGAMNIANSGDIILVNARTNAYDFVNMKNGVRLYGATGNGGSRASINGFTIMGATLPTSIMGFNITGASGVINSSNVVVNGNLFTATSNLAVQDSSSILFKNNVFCSAKNVSSGGCFGIATSPVYITGASTRVDFLNNAFTYKMLVGTDVTVSFKNNFFGNGSELTLGTNSRVTSSGNNYSYLNGMTVNKNAQLVSTGDYFRTSSRGASNYSCAGFISYTSRESKYGIYNWGGTVSISDPLNKAGNIKVERASMSALKTDSSLNTNDDSTTTANMSVKSRKEGFATRTLEETRMTASARQVLADFLTKKEAASQGQTSQLGEMELEDMEAVRKLEDILNNPTDDQKAILDAVADLLAAIADVEDASGQDPQLKKTTDGLLEVLANALLAQAMPDLLRKEDMATMKDLFTEIGSAKNEIINRYQAATAPYYVEIKKLLIKNAENLRLDEILSKNNIRRELEDLPPSEIDKIIEKLKKFDKRNFEEEYVLQQAGKLQKEYIEPNKSNVEAEMKSMLEEATKRLAGVLEMKKEQ